MGRPATLAGYWAGSHLSSDDDTDRAQKGKAPLPFTLVRVPRSGLLGFRVDFALVYPAYPPSCGSTPTGVSSDTTTALQIAEFRVDGACCACAEWSSLIGRTR